MNIYDMVTPPPWKPSLNYIRARQTAKFLWFEGTSDRFECLKHYRKKASKRQALDDFLDPLLENGAGFLGVKSFSTRSLAQGRLLKSSRTMTSEDIATRAAVLDQAIAFLNPKLAPWSFSEPISNLYRRFSMLPKYDKRPPETIESVNKIIDNLPSSSFSRAEAGKLAMALESSFSAYIERSIDTKQLYLNSYDEHSDYGIETRKYLELQNDTFDILESKSTSTLESLLSLYLATKLLSARVIDKYESIIIGLAQAHADIGFRIAFTNTSPNNATKIVMNEKKPKFVEVAEELNSGINLATNSLNQVFSHIASLKGGEHLEKILFILPRIAYDIFSLPSFSLGIGEDETIERLCHNCYVPLHLRHRVLEETFEKKINKNRDEARAVLDRDLLKIYCDQSINKRISGFWL